MGLQMKDKLLLAVAAAFKAVTGLALVIAPSIVRVLLWTDISGRVLVIARMGGVGLLLPGVACWPRVEGTIPRLRAMLIYNLLATAYLGYLRFSSQSIGKLLLPALAVHAILTILFLGVWLKQVRVRPKSYCALTCFGAICARGLLGPNIMGDHAMSAISVAARE
jgi:hypothetical protein